MASSGLTAEGRAKLILDMASDHMSVDDEVREKALDSLAKAVKNTPEITLVDIFKQESLGSATDLKYLDICHQYLDIRLEDEAFARLAAANGMVGESTLSAALERQKSSFENYQIIMPLVEILDETHGMSTADSTAVLLTQNRIKSNGLAEALNALGRTAKEKEAVNRRFGAFVIKQGLATLDKVNTALDKQRSHWQAGSSFPFISDILKETETLPESDILRLLEEQRQFEKRRLDLEKALYTPKTERNISKQLSKIFVLIISPDGTEAVIKRREEADRDMPVYHLLIWLKRAGITAGIVEDVTLAAFIRESKVKDSLIVARGYPPQPGIDQRIAFYFDRPVTETEQETSPPQIFPKGSLIARIVPGIPGKPGKDVTGRPIPAPKPKPITMNAGTGIIRKGNEFFAASQGAPELSDDGGTLLIPPEIPREQTKRITTTIREDTGDRYASVDVDLKADIGQEGVLRCNNLVVHGNIEGQALCSGTLEVRGAIGRNPSSEKENVGHRTELFSSGQMTVSKDIYSARLISGDRLTAVNATIVAAEIIAHKGITIKSSEGSSDAPVVLRFGLAPGHKLLALDHTLTTKQTRLIQLKKTDEIKTLTSAYEEEAAAIEALRLEQTLLKQLKVILKAPELYQYAGLDAKLSYLRGLPAYSSVRACYLTLPENDVAATILSGLMESLKGLPEDQTLLRVKEKIRPVPDTDETDAAYQAEMQFKGNLAALEQAVDENMPEIKKLEAELKQLALLKKKLEALEATVAPPSGTGVRIRHKCGKGTVIKGRLSGFVAPRDLYNLRFREIADPKTGIARIELEN